MLKVEEEPLHNAEGEADTEDGSVDKVFNVTIVETHDVELQKPSALT